MHWCGSVRVRYSVPVPQCHPYDAMRNLRSVMQQDITLAGDVNVVSENHPLSPRPSVQQQPVRDPAVLEKGQLPLDIAR